MAAKPTPRRSRPLNVDGHPSMCVSSTIRSARGCVMAGRPRERRVAWCAKHATPNPGTYNPSDPDSTSKILRSPRAVIGCSTTGRLESNKSAADGNSLTTASDAPGPGSYSHKEYIGHCEHIGKSTMDSPRLTPRTVAWNAKHATPNPGTYDPNDPDASKMTKSPRPVMGFASTGRLELGRSAGDGNSLTKLDVESPGPGTYTHKDFLNQRGSTCKPLLSSPRQSPRTLAWKASHSTPNPGTYTLSDPDSTGKMTKSPRPVMGFSSTGRLDLSKCVSEGSALISSGNGVPGPGEYEHQELIGKCGGATLAKDSPRSSPREVAWKAKHGVPNPGTYNPNDPDSTSKMPKSPRAVIGCSSTGRLEMDKSVSEGNSLMKIGQAVPGPGAYAHPELIGKGGSGGKPLLSSARMAARPSAFKAKHGTPNPGTYNPSDPESTSKVARSPRPIMGFSSTGRLEMDKSAADGNSFSRTGRGVPGPGTYAHKELLGKCGSSNKSLMDCPRVSPRPAAWKARHCAPNPGTYNPNGPESTAKMRSAASHGFGSAATGRLTTSANQTPGPGSYGGHYTQF
eukprot:TRINITY_DN12793_c0_g7_i1.p1 TRINITY_DN12793_c0_g7~~TRINITY_DN12793_c0_g7_i1.p1  ORF type:complete len:568 (+),score=15.25 TRINITY_DN12793_c0_g7_i1:46-1749(+)